MFACNRTERAASFAALSKRWRSGVRRLLAPLAPALDGRLQLAAGRELRHGRSRDVHLLAGITRIDTLPRRAVRRRELAKARERDRVAAAKRVRHALENRVDRGARITTREIRL